MPTMKGMKKNVRRSISLPGDLDAKVQKIARHENRSANRVLENLIETGLQARETEKRRFFELAERLRETSDETEVLQIKAELARMTFGA